MSSKIGLPNESSITTIYNIPQDPLLLIFQSLDLPGCLIARKVCKSWAEFGKHPLTIFGRYLQEKAQIEKFVTLEPRFSDWQQMPRHWGLQNDKKMLQFSSICSDIISFFPPFCTQSSKFFSFTRALSFSDRDILLAQHKSTYFLTPQSQTRLQLKLQTDLRPLVSHTLIVKNVNDPQRDRTFSLLEDLPETEENLITHQIEYCFPVSEDKVVIITRNKVASLWNLQPIKPVCDKKLIIYDRLPTLISSGLYRVGDHFLIGNHLIELKDLSNREQDFNFIEYSHIKTFGCFTCGAKKNEQEIHLFSLSEFGLLEKKWDFKVDKGLIESKWGSILSFKIENMSENFIILSSWHESAVNLVIVNMNGKLVDFINKDIVGESIEYSEIWTYPIFAHISDNILIFKHPQQHTLYFWHIPTKACISEFEWTKTVYDLALYCDKAKVQDIHFADGKLTILLTTEHVEGSNRPAQFRVLQFDALYTIPSGLLLRSVSRMFATVKGLYYAVPGKNPT
jgi:hypothetical protein